MNDRRRGLGRGLGSLIPQGPIEDDPAYDSSSVATRERPLRAVDPAPALSPAETSPQAGQEPVAGAYFAEIPLARIMPNPRQPRQIFEEEALAELVTSLKEVGLLQPVVVREAGHAADGQPLYELIMGERRWRASQLAGFDAVPAIVRSTDDDRLLLDALLENLHRSALNPLEEAAAYDQLLQDFGCTHEALAARIGRSRSQVTNTIRLLRLPAGRPAQGRGRGALGRARSRAARHRNRGGPGAPRRPHRRRGAVGPRGRGAGRDPGHAPGRSRASRRASRRPAPALDDLASSLADRWETRVRVQLGQKRGRIVVDFASVEDLERIVALMAPGADGIGST